MSPLVVATFVGTFAAFVAGSAAATEPTAPLLVVEQQRSTLVARLAQQWGPGFDALPAPRRLSQEQFASEIWSLRADRLFAVALAGDVETIEAVLGDARNDALPLRAAQAKSLGDATADLTYTPLNPCRILDTRVVGGPLAANVARTFNGYATNFSAQGGTATNCGIPNGVAALAMNVYAVNPTNLGFIKVWPANGAEPAVSTVNYQVGITAIATGALVPVDAGNSNRFTAKSPAGVGFIADVVGYFKAPGDANGLDIKVAGQRVMRLEHDAISPNVIGGNPANVVTAGVRGATISGGGVPTGDSDPSFFAEAPNQVTDHYGTVAGGYANQAGDGAGTTGDRAFGTVGGGLLNIARGTASTIGGGLANSANGAQSVVGGGESNSAVGLGSTVGGGGANAANGTDSMVPGGFNNIAGGTSSFAAGHRARANNAGCFVWADSSSYNNTTSCFANNEFVAKAVGGFYFWTSGTSDANYAGARLAPGAGAWSAYSDRAGKENVERIDAVAVLNRVASMPIATWNWKAQDADVRHMGPMAQDFHAAFGLGESDTMISTVDADGVALAAIQGLHQVVQAKDAEIALLKADANVQKREVAELRRLVELLLARTGGEAPPALLRAP